MGDFVDVANNYDEMTKVIAPGILLHKKVIEKNANKDIEVYSYRVELVKLDTIDFIADFTGSIGATIEGEEGLITTTEIFPFQTKIVAKIILKGKWNLKQKFKILQKVTPKSIQLNYAQGAKDELKAIILQSYQHIGNFIPINDINIEEAQQVIQEAGVIYIDKEFPPDETSIFNDDTDTSNFNIIEQWRRPIDFMKGEMDDDEQNQIQVFHTNIEPADVQEGQLGDGWFLSALATLAEKPGLIQRLFVNKEYNEEGIYRVKLCKNGEWIYVTIDDYFPCAAMGGPIFCKNNDTELFVMILQKAYAKVHGNYFLLKGGHAYEALYDLTGCPVQYYDFGEKNVTNLIDQEELWPIIKNSYDQNSIVSFSMFGEERWSDEGVINFDNAITQLLQGHSYSMIGYYEDIDNKLIQLRNPWENLGYKWDGDYCEPNGTTPHKFWTKILLDRCKPSFDNGAFWMPYKDAITYFQAMNVCLTRPWQETRIKGKFVKIEDCDNPNNTLVLSKWYYCLNIKEENRIIIGIHQEDERIRGVVQHRPYLDIGLAILKKTTDGALILHDLKDNRFERQTELDITLTEGEYIIVPRSTGCTLKNYDKLGVRIPLLNPETKQLSDVVKSTVIDIFRKFDMKQDYTIEYQEFVQFMDCVGHQCSQEEWDSDILENYNSTQQGLTQIGFIDFWLDKIKELEEEEIWNWFYQLGYDDELHSVRSRAFMMSIHSDNPIDIVVRDELSTDLDQFVNIQVVLKYGKEMNVRKGVRAFYSFSENIHGYTYIVINDQLVDVEVTLDCSLSENMIFSTQTSIIKQLVSPGEAKFMLHVVAIPTADSFLRSATCIWMAAR